MDSIFFQTPAEFRAWLAEYGSLTEELWVGFHKKKSGKPSMRWPESVDEALCYGWIDSLRKSIDDESYKIRFTPRRAGSIWSSVNINRVEELIAEGKMQPAGIQAFESRNAEKSGIYSYERKRSIELPEFYSNLLQANEVAWKYYQNQPPSYHKAISWWIVSAKREETKLRRIEKLITYSVKGKRVPEFTLQKE